jgi:hypothetical protein
VNAGREGSTARGAGGATTIVRIEVEARCPTPEARGLLTPMSSLQPPSSISCSDHRREV